jgi:pilus assembly protein CpaE
MSGSRDRFQDDGDLDQLAQDLDLDMDAPIGASFAAALRGKDEPAPLEADFALDDDGFMTPPRPATAADPAPAVFADDPSHEGEDLTFGADDFADDAEPFDAPFPQSLAQADAPLPPPSSAHAAPPPGSSEHAHKNWFKTKEEADLEPSPIPELPPQLATEIEPEGEESDAAGQGLGYDYSFGGAHAGGDRTIPRITIHAFCTRTSSLGLLRTVSKDRRMKNVTMEVFEGGVPSAIAYYVNETTPNLLIIEGSGDPVKLLGELDSLAEYCDENIRVVVLGQTNDIRLYRELMRRGVSEYLVAPFDPVHMIRSIGSLFTDPEAPFTGKTLAVTGVKGGVGASSIAHNLAWALSERCKVNATLVDLDLNFGTTGLDFNQDATATIADALMSPDRFDDAVMGRLISKATDRLSLFTAPATLDRTFNLDPDTYVRVLEQVRGSVPFVVLDLPHVWSDWFKSTVISADELVIVAGPDLASLRNGKNLIDFLKAARPNDNPPKLVLNMVGLPKRPEIPAKDFGQAIGVEPSLVLPFDAQLFGTAANNGQMIFDVAPESKVAQGLDQLAALLTGKEIQAEKPSLMKKLLGK